MRIGISAPFRMYGGSEVFVRHLLRAWSASGTAHDVVLFTSRSNLEVLGPEITERVSVRPLPHAQGNLPARLLWEQLSMPRRLARERLDVLLSPANTAPLRSPVPSVVVFRNAAPWCPSVTLRTAGAYDWARFRALSALMRASARQAARVVFISHFFRDLFMREYGFPASRGDVVYNGRDGLSFDPPDPEHLRSLGIRPPYFLSVGHLYHYKRFPTLVDGWARSRTARASRQLVFVGGTLGGPDHRAISGRIAKGGVEGSVHFVGPQPHRAIGPLIAGCDGFVFQSTCENCPNALIEALAAGVPIASSNVGVMPEIAGDAAIYYDPTDPEDIARALDRLADDGPSRAQLRARATQQALRFPTWRDVADQILASLTRAAAG
jgi:glycosyltransferase involved in cell wall biosynthesis